LGERFHSQLSTEKIAWIARLSKVLADHYRIAVERWAVGLAKREALGSTGLGYGVGLLHQFQDFRHPFQVHRLANAPVDWWLFLFPEGAEWDAFDGSPVFGMIGHVFASLQPGLQLRAYILTTQAAGAVTLTGQEMDPTAWQRLAKLDRISAARRLNAAVLHCLARGRRTWYGIGRQHDSRNRDERGITT
jgi:mannitol/fructose-specific phosphotransferase system IIA component